MHACREAVIETSRHSPRELDRIARFGQGILSFRITSRYRGAFVNSVKARYQGPRLFDDAQ